MSGLSTDAIRSRLNDTPERRLVVSPLLDMADQIKPGQASVDVRLGFEFCLVGASEFGCIGEFDGEVETDSFEPLYNRRYVPLGSHLVIHPHQFMLAQTLEYIRLPSDLMAYVVGRSTWGRLGLIVATAVGIHPNYAGCLTLELRNLGETPLALYPGQTIAQLFFHTVSDENGQASKATSPRAQYSGAVDMVPKQISSDKTKQKLKKLIKRYNDLTR